MIETMLFAIILAKIRGYKLSALFKSWYIYPIFAFNLMYIFGQVMIFSGKYDYVKYSRMFETLYICAFLILIIKFKLYISALIGSACIFIGSTFNRIAILSNNGKMPVFPTLSYLTGYVKYNSFNNINDIHVLGNAATKVKLLTDVIDIGYSVMSIGDIFIRVFSFLLVFNVIKSISAAKTGIEGTR